jgi:hypothetical protein
MKPRNAWERLRASAWPSGIAACWASERAAAYGILLVADPLTMGVPASARIVSKRADLASAAAAPRGSYFTAITERERADAVLTLDLGAGRFCSSFLGSRKWRASLSRTRLLAR